MEHGSTYVMKYYVKKKLNDPNAKSYHLIALTSFVCPWNDLIGLSTPILQT